ncbi:MAG TPA: cell division protein FtsL [Gammaproteobacteria bacterium]|nr:cell division protein FtsL [Gammaproteobacteria bacterium]
MSVQRLVILYLLVIVSALALVYTRVATRHNYLDLQAHQQERDRLNVEWGRLLLQEARYAEPRYIEKRAREQLGMRVPVRDEMMVVRLQ